MRRSVVGIVCVRRDGGQGGVDHAIDAPYVTAVRDGMDAVPLLIPVCDPPLDPADILAAVDGIMFSGGVANIEPHRYGAVALAGQRFDPARDATVLPLIRTALAQGVPVFGICRGLQELNVALGGTLHQRVHEVPGRFDHRSDEAAPMDVQYALAHEVCVSDEGLLSCVLPARRFRVNSVHGQGIDRLADGLRVEALADDGTIEAVSCPAAPAFALAVQWHPEWHWRTCPSARALFAAFAAAVADGARAAPR